jgi:hypothetical protein
MIGVYNWLYPIQTSYRSTKQKVACVWGIVASREIFTMNSDQARQRAEKSFKKEERAQDGRAAMTEYETEAHATREKTARLKALRLAKEAQTVIAL